MMPATIPRAERPVPALARAAYFEAGALVLAECVGRRVTTATLTCRNTIRGRHAFALDPAAPTDARAACWRELAVLLAGPITEARYLRWTPQPGPRRWHRAHALADRAIANLATSPAERSALLMDAEYAVRAYLADPAIWRAVDGTAARLIRHRTITGAEVRALLFTPPATPAPDTSASTECTPMTEPIRSPADTPEADAEAAVRVSPPRRIYRAIHRTRQDRRAIVTTPRVEERTDGQ